MRMIPVFELEKQINTNLHASDTDKNMRPIVVSYEGKAAGVLVWMDDEDEIERLLMAYNPKIQQIFEDADKRFKEGKGIPHDEFWAMLAEEDNWADDFSTHADLESDMPFVMEDEDTVTMSIEYFNRLMNTIYVYETSAKNSASPPAMEMEYHSNGKILEPVI
ncbi:MAG: hypothetical protein AAF639_27095 [Chloroflexota bacterium]